MQPHQERVVQEKADLDEKIQKLESFVSVSPASSATFNSLPEGEQFRLTRQLGIMKDYSTVLGERIAAFPKGEEN